MAAPKQRTLASEASLDGVGVHSGEASTLTLCPAPADHGIVFRRVDLEGAPGVPADLDHVSGTELGTTLAMGEAHVLTVEHVLAALAAHNVDNAVLELTGPEPPIRDGSFRDFYDAVEEAGVVEQEAAAQVLEVREPVHVDGGKGVDYVCAPHDGYRISATIDFAHPAIGRQFGSWDFGERAFPGQIAPARTFGFKEQAEALQARGLARGASLENTIVLDESGVMNDGLRFPDEFVRHKVGDIIGDLSLLGRRIRGHVVAQRPSHAGNVALARALRDHALSDQRPRVEATEIMQYLPHRYPMLLVDRITAFEKGKRIVGLKNVTINEPFFQGHYPGHPIMPGVLIIEAMAQVGGLLLMDVVDDPEDKVVYFMSLDDVKWRRPVIPGDQIVFELELLQFRRGVCKMAGTGKVDGNVVAEAKLMARVMDR
ncbi:MAG: bifunctional UDP-3-O-[3-hydroxymyristoyl] N-acetylglucosamine deacetylase/3-hydroxyacyl-ACP dehydratase [Gemmatimonadales bacterium]|nr:MAG: bifunctional UDP-3-O-[3-hydroxymyristoyl] N-acetylglucosamine deacetylase/3-hydroxyacyl-ACP dehydratase [Gemmatimonadales bacterium]